MKFRQPFHEAQQLSPAGQKDWVECRVLDHGPLKIRERVGGEGVLRKMTSPKVNTTVSKRKTVKRER